MKITLLYSLLIYLQQYGDAAVSCKTLQEVENAVLEEKIPGSSIDIYAPYLDCDCVKNSTDDTYILLHQDHQTGKLKVESRQQDYKFTISNIQLNTSGVYCMYKQCAPKDKEKCCVRIPVRPEVQLILSDTKTSGVCQAKLWPTDEMYVFTSDTDDCTVTKYPVNNINTYTMAVNFTVENITSSCNIYCMVGTCMNNIIINPTGITPTTSHGTTTKVPTITSEYNNSVMTTTTPDSGVIGIYRMTVWIIILALTVVSTTIL